MRIGFIAALLLTASQATAAQVECKDAVALARSTGAMVATFNGLTDACKDKVGTDATCRTYADLINQNALSENMIALSAQILLIAVKCPDEP